MDKENQQNIDVGKVRFDKSVKKLEEKVAFLKKSLDTLGHEGRNTAGGQSLRKQLNSAKRQLFKSRNLVQARDSNQ